jgi:hypothetical protein
LRASIASFTTAPPAESEARFAFVVSVVLVVPLLAAGFDRGYQSLG